MIASTVETTPNQQVFYFLFFTVHSFHVCPIICMLGVGDSGWIIGRCQ